jgi:hypothetical protein
MTFAELADSVARVRRQIIDFWARQKPSRPDDPKTGTSASDDPMSV